MRHPVLTHREIDAPPSSHRSACIFPSTLGLRLAAGDCGLVIREAAESNLNVPKAKSGCFFRLGGCQGQENTPSL